VLIWKSFFFVGWVFRSMLAQFVMLPASFLDAREAAEQVEMRHELTCEYLEFAQNASNSKFLLSKERLLLLYWQKTYVSLEKKLERFQFGLQTKPIQKLIQLQIALARDTEKAHFLQTASVHFIQNRQFEERTPFLEPLFEDLPEETDLTFPILTKTLDTYYELQALVERYLFLSDEERRNTQFSWKIAEKYRNLRHFETTLERVESVYEKLYARVGHLLGSGTRFQGSFKERRLQLMRLKLRLGWVSAFIQTGNEKEARHVLAQLEPELVKWTRSLFSKSQGMSPCFSPQLWKAIETDLYALIGRRGWATHACLKPVAQEVRRWHQTIEQKFLRREAYFEGDTDFLIRNDFLKLEIQIEGFYLTLRQGTREEVETGLKNLRLAFDQLAAEEQKESQPHRSQYLHRLAVVLAVFQGSRDAKLTRGTLEDATLSRFQARVTNTAFLVHSALARFAYWTFIELYFLTLGVPSELFLMAQQERLKLLPEVLQISASSAIEVPLSAQKRATEFQKKLYQNLKEEIHSLQSVGEMTEAFFHDDERNFRMVFEAFREKGKGVHFLFFRYAFDLMSRLRGWMDLNASPFLLTRKQENHLDQYFHDFFQTLRYFSAVKEGHYEKALRWIWGYVKEETKAGKEPHDLWAEMEWVAQQAIAAGQLEPWHPLVKGIERTLGENIDLDWREWFERQRPLTEMVLPSNQPRVSGSRLKQPKMEAGSVQSFEKKAVELRPHKWYFPELSREDPRAAAFIQRIYSPQSQLTRTEVRWLFDRLSLFFGEEPLKPRFKGSHLKVFYPLWLQRSMEGRVFCVLNAEMLRPFQVQQLRRGLRDVGFSPED
jgi:hypothetical protein